MRLFEMKPLPQRAGLAVLDFRERVDIARRDEVITIPLDPEAMEFFPLQGGTQFLLKSDGSLHFGGTDERPFLVELEDEAFAFFARGGEEAFYEALKPPPIKEIEQTYTGRDAALRRTKRQGDIFAHALRWSWKMLILRHLEAWTEVTLKRHKDARVFGTRHTLTGYGAFLKVPEIGKPVVIAEGVIEAPDHAPLVLRGPHVIEQTAFLLRPREAD